MPAVITPRALAALIAGRKNDEIIKVRVKDSTGYQYFGHVGDLLVNSKNSELSNCSIIADGGDVIWGVPVHHIEWIDVRPRPDGH